MTSQYKRHYKVYGWTQSAPWDGEHPVYEHMSPDYNTIRCVMAANSMAEVARIMGVAHPRKLWNICETGNDTEIEAAMGNPHVVYCRGNRVLWGPYVRLHREGWRAS